MMIFDFMWSGKYQYGFKQLSNKGVIFLIFVSVVGLVIGCIIGYSIFGSV